jgi:hypothetical protein
MKLKKSILALTLPLFFSACLSDETGLSADPGETLSTAPAGTQSVTTALADVQDCFDLKMETWYAAFHTYQAAGYDMETADRKAVAMADEKYNACLVP